jgi:hypothetical protein
MYKRYADRHPLTTTLEATFMRFNPEMGSYFTGKDGTLETLTGHEMLADVNRVLEGFQRFPPQTAKNKAPTYAVAPVNGKLVDRNVLGDLDPTRWEPGKFVDRNTGRREPRDPWQSISVMGMHWAERPDMLFAFATPTPSGAAAIGELMMAAGEHIDEGERAAQKAMLDHEVEDELLPMVVLEAKRINDRLFVPVFRVIAWEPWPAGLPRLKAPPLPIASQTPQGELFNPSPTDDDNIPF